MKYDRRGSGERKGSGDRKGSGERKGSGVKLKAIPSSTAFFDATVCSPTRHRSPHKSASVYSYFPFTLPGPRSPESAALGLRRATLSPDNRRTSGRTRIPSPTFGPKAKKKKNLPALFSFRSNSSGSPNGGTIPSNAVTPKRAFSFMSIFSPFSSGFGSLSTYFSPTSTNTITLHPSVVSAIKSLEKRTDVETRGIARGRGKEKKSRSTPRRGGIVDDQVDFVQDLTTPFRAESLDHNRNGYEIGSIFSRIDDIEVEVEEGKSIISQSYHTENLEQIGISDEIPNGIENDNIQDKEMKLSEPPIDSVKKIKTPIIKKGSKDDLYVGKSLIFSSPSGRRGAGCVEFEGLSPREIDTSGRSHSDDDDDDDDGDDNDDEDEEDDDEEEEGEGESQSQCTLGSDQLGTKEDKDEEEEEEEDDGQALYPNILFTQTEILGLRLMFSLFDRYGMINKSQHNVMQ